MGVGTKVRLGTGIAALVLAAIVVGAAIMVSGDRAFSQLETTLFTVVILGLSILGSALVTYLLSRDDAKHQYRGLARPALRRVLALNDSAIQIRQAIEAKKALLETLSKQDVAVVGEWLDAVDRLIKQHIGQLGAAITDWQDLLPEEYKELAEIASVRDELEAKVEQFATAGEKDREELSKQIKGLQVQLVTLRSSSTSPSLTPLLAGTIDADFASQFAPRLSGYVVPGSTHYEWIPSEVPTVITPSTPPAPKPAADKKSSPRKKATD